MQQYIPCVLEQLAHKAGALLTLLNFSHSHLGRPKGVDQRFSLARITAHLSALLEMEASCACITPLVLDRSASCLAQQV